MLETNLSNESNIVNPKIFIFAKTPSGLADNAASEPIKTIIKIFIIIDFFLEIFSSSVNKAIRTSNKDIVAAIAANPKKIIDKILPPGIFANINGTVLNNNPGPSVGASPKEKTAGKIASPASNDTPVSAIATFPAVPIKLLSSVK